MPISTVEYLEEVGVVYRWFDPKIDGLFHEISNRVATWNNGVLIKSEVLITLKKSAVYRLVCHWNRQNRLQGSKYYYEIET